MSDVCLAKLWEMRRVTIMILMPVILTVTDVTTVVSEV